MVDTVVEVQDFLEASLGGLVFALYLGEGGEMRQCHGGMEGELVKEWKQSRRC